MSDHLQSVVTMLTTLDRIARDAFVTFDVMCNQQDTGENERSLYAKWRDCVNDEYHTATGEWLGDPHE